jgi:hypothetical protein
MIFGGFARKSTEMPHGSVLENGAGVLVATILFSRKAEIERFGEPTGWMDFIRAAVNPQPHTLRYDD